MQEKKKIENIKKIVLAYSGGLDTSVMIRYLKEKYNAEIIAYLADLGQGEDIEALRQKALKIGANKAYAEDLKEEFIKDFIFPTLKAGAQYEEGDLLATALGRPLIAKGLVKTAKKEGADTVAHGCTGKGNDQVRFEVTIGCLAPHLKVLAPARDWEFRSREEEVEYAQRHNIPVEVTKKNPYSIDRNLWGTSVECGPLEDPTLEPPQDAFQMCKNPNKIPEKPFYLEVEFEKGIPIKLNGNHLSSIEIINRLNEIGSTFGIGQIDMIENRLVGIKSRELYEAPAATILRCAHTALESLVLDRELLHFKQLISHKYSELVYYGLWYSPLKEALDAFIEKTQQKVSGIIRLKLTKHRVIAVGRSSSYSLYKKELATYTAEDTFDQKAAEGFIKLWGLPYKGSKEI